jgi:hypothetical protein
VQGCSWGVGCSGSVTPSGCLSGSNGTCSGWHPCPMSGTFTGSCKITNCVNNPFKGCEVGMDVAANMTIAANMTKYCDRSMEGTEFGGCKGFSGSGRLFPSGDEFKGSGGGNTPGGGGASWNIDAIRTASNGVIGTYQFGPSSTRQGYSCSLSLFPISAAKCFCEDSKCVVDPTATLPCAKCNTPGACV